MLDSIQPMFCSNHPCGPPQGACRAAKKGAAMENKFLAHIAEDGREQTVFEHLAAEFSRPFGGEAQGLLAGTSHDIGKYSAAFQRRLTGDSRRVDHATAGAFECMGRGQPFAAFAVAGHHGGLRMAAGAETAEAATFWGRINRRVAAGWSLTAPGSGRYPCPADNLPSQSRNPERVFFTCMLYSCLVTRISGYRGLHVREAEKELFRLLEKKALPSGHTI